MSRRSMRLPIVLAIVMIVMLVVLTVGWVLLNVGGALQDDRYSPLVLDAAYGRLGRSSRCC